jgi:AmmeMemoRadiSam system protein B
MAERSLELHAHHTCHTCPRTHVFWMQAEHSLELHTPYIVRVMSGRRFTLVPIMVGALTPDA